MTTFTFSVGDLLSNELTIKAIRGRWVDLSDGTTISRAQVGLIGARPTQTPSGTTIDFSAYRENYIKTKSADGRRRVDSGDAVAMSLRGTDIEGVYDIVAEATGVPAVELRTKYRHLNIGQQRMNLGNRLRAHLKRVENGEV